MKIKDSQLNWHGYIVAATEFLPERSHLDILILHGAGKASQELVRPIAENLAKRGCRAVTFDFISHGRSSGRLEELNLELRQQQAEFVLKSFDMTREVTLIGFSMGGQTSIDVATNKANSVKSMILFAPAVYDKAARQAYFGHNSAFSVAIRRPNSWLDSDAWDKLSVFNGKLLVMQAENDTVIPNTLPGMLFDNALKASHRTHILLHGLPHTLARFSLDHPNVATWFAESIKNFVQDEPFTHPKVEVSYRILSEQKRDGKIS